MHRYLLLVAFLLVAPVVCLDVQVAFGIDEFPEFFFFGNPLDGYPEYYELLFEAISDLYRINGLDLFGQQFDSFDATFIYWEFPSLHDFYINIASFAPFPASHTTIFAPPGDYVGITEFGFFPYYYYEGESIPAEYLGIDFSIPVTSLFAEFWNIQHYLNREISEHYYYQTVVDYVDNWPYEQLSFQQGQEDELEFILPFHITAKTVDGYFYYDWLIPRGAKDYGNYYDWYGWWGNYQLYALYTRFTVLASDPRGIEMMKVYSLLPENNREDIYFFYNENFFTLPYDYHWLYMERMIAQIASPSTTRTISATVSPTPNFLRQPSHSATRSPSVTHTAGTITPTSSHSPIFKSGSNTPTRTPNLSPSRSPTPSGSTQPLASSVASASAQGQTATATATASPSLSKSPVTPTTSPTVTNTATGTRTAFLTASNTQQPGRNVPSASIAPSSSPASKPFLQPDSSSAALVQFNVLCAGYCSGESAAQLQIQIAKALNLNEEFIRIVAIHEFFEGDSEITILICSNDNVDDLLNDIQGGSFVQSYFIAISVESVDWTVRCDMDLYNYLALSSQYIDTASSANSLLPLFVLFILQLWLA